MRPRLPPAVGYGTMRLAWIAIHTLGPALATGCGGIPGELGAGEFEYQPIRDEDFGSNWIIAADGIAVGASFGLTFRADDEDASAFAVTPAAAGRAAVDAAGSITLLDAGAQAVVARRRHDGRAVDFLYIHGVEPRFELFRHEFIYQLDEPEPEPATWYLDSVALVAGTSSWQIVAPVGPEHRVLRGGFSYTWSIDDEAIASLAELPADPGELPLWLRIVDDGPIDSSWALLVGVAPGVTTLRIGVNGEERVVKRVTVLHGEYAPAP